MASEKAWYWAAVAVLILGLGNSFVNRHQDWSGSLADRSLAVAQRISGQAMAYLEMAEMELGRHAARCPRTELSAARLQTKFASMQAVIASRQAEFATLEARRAQLEALQEVRRSMICPRQGFSIEMPQAPVAPVLADHGTI